MTVKIFESTFMEVTDSIPKVEEVPDNDRAENEEMFEDEWEDEILMHIWER